MKRLATFLAVLAAAAAAGWLERRRDPSAPDELDYCGWDW